MRFSKLKKVKALLVIAVIFVFIVNLFFSNTASAYQNTGKLWFGPYPISSGDFKNLFTEPDRWKDARSSLSVFKFYDQYLNPQWEYQWVVTLNHPEDANKFMNNTELTDAITKLKLWGMEMDFETGAIKNWGCTGDITYADAKIPLDRVASLGGNVKYISMDEPFLGGTALPQDAYPGCGYSIDKTLDETIRFINLIKSQYAGITIGDIEPWPYFSKDQLEQWISGFRQKAGYELPFLHLDVNYALAKVRNSNLQDLRDLADFCRSRGIKFGMIINDNGYFYPAVVDSDRGFYDSSMAWASIIHSITPMDEVIVQTWDPFPKLNLPDNSGYSFTQLARDYAASYPPGIKPVIPAPALDVNCPAGQTYSNLLSLSSNTISQSIIEAGGGRLIIVVQAADDTLWEKELSDTAGTPTIKDWSYINGATLSRPKIIKINGVLYLNVIGADGIGIWRSQYDNTSHAWSGWTTTGLAATQFGNAGPSAVTANSGTYRVTGLNPIMLQSCQSTSDTIAPVPPIGVKVS